MNGRAPELPLRLRLLFRESGTLSNSLKCKYVYALNLFAKLFISYI